MAAQEPNTQYITTEAGPSGSKFLQFLPGLMVVVVMAAGALIGSSLVQKPIYRDGFAGCCNDNCTCACWGGGTDKSWYCSTCRGEQYVASSDSCQPAGGSSGTTSGGTTSDGYSQTACQSACLSIKQSVNGGVVGGRKNVNKNEGGVKSCECYCKVGDWNSSFSACDGGKSAEECTDGTVGQRDGCTYQCENGSWVEKNCGPGTTTGTGGAGTGGTTATPSTSTQNKSAGDLCNPQAAGSLPQNGGCDGTGPLSCIVCPGGTAKSGQNVCSLFNTAAQVGADCGGYTTGNISAPSQPVGDTNITCSTNSQSNCGGKNVGDTCIASGNATGYCTSSGSTTCSCVTATNQPITIGGGGSCESGLWNVYECDGTNHSSGCQDTSLGTVNNEEVSRLMSQTPQCKTRQADCVNSNPLVFRSVINNPGSHICGGTATTTTTTPTGGTGSTGTSGGTQDTTTTTTTTTTTQETFYCSGLEPSVISPKIGDIVTYTCSAAGLGADQVTSYNFQYRVNSGAFSQIGISSVLNNVSVGLAIDQPGTYEVQCRACSQTTCTEWDTL